MARDPIREMIRVGEETVKRIREAQKGASVHVAELLGLIADGLLDPKLQVQDLLRKCASRDKNISTRFAEEMGLAPKEFMTHHRMGIVVYGLESTDLKIWQIAMYAGYSGGHILGQAFKRWTRGQTPTAFRKAAREAADEPEPVAAPADLVDEEEVRRAVTGELPAEQAASVADGLDVLQDQVRGSYWAPGPPIPYSEPTKVRGLWRVIADLPAERQLRAVRLHAADFDTPALFHRLCTVAIEAGAYDAERGRWFAKLAIESLEPLLGRIDDGLMLNLFARAHAVVGNALRRSGRLEEAGRAFGIAFRTLEEAGDAAHPVVVAEFFLYAACFEIERDNFRMAAVHLEEGLKLWRGIIAKLAEQEQKAAAAAENAAG